MLIIYAVELGLLRFTLSSILKSVIEVTFMQYLGPPYSSSSSILNRAI